jgi:hypothetical protein
MTLHLSQSREYDQETSLDLIYPLSDREEDVLRSLIRLCLLEPYTYTSLQKMLKSNGLYIISLCLNPDDSAYTSPTFLEIDAINALVILTPSIPLITEPVNKGRGFKTGYNAAWETIVLTSCIFVKKSIFTRELEEL